MNGNRSKSRIEILLILLVEGLLLKLQCNYSKNRESRFAARHFQERGDGLESRSGAWFARCVDSRLAFLVGQNCDRQAHAEHIEILPFAFLSARRQKQK